MSTAEPHDPHQSSAMIVVASNRNQSIMVATIIIMTILVIEIGRASCRERV